MSGPILLGLRILLIVSLYGLLGWAFFTLWRDLRRQVSMTHVAAVPLLRLSGEAETGETYNFSFSLEEISAGRDPAADLCLDHPTISAHHARLSYHHSQWWLEDLHSKNGTFLNGELVREPMVITQGDRLGFGQVSLQIEIES
jgi:pSer/pThr/pTyr-binding forkhead associated (FHA) protein